MINSFEQYIDKNILNSLRKGITDFNDIILSLSGVYPSNVLSSIKRVTKNSFFPGDLYSKILGQVKENTNLNNEAELHKIVLPLEHPLDFEWRFTKLTTNYMLDICKELVSSDDKIVLLGTPSLFRNIIEEECERKIIFVGDETAVTNRLKMYSNSYKMVFSNIIKDPPQKILASAVILDPPWYDDYIYPFLWYATQCCKLNGYIMISLPSLGTRPEVKEELETIINQAKLLGLSTYRIEHGTLRYTTPFFENNALNAEGIYNFPKDWRSSNLVIFKHDKECDMERPKISFPYEWEEVNFNDVRIRVKKNYMKEFGDPALISILDGDILPSVSRKYHKRNLAEVWTSGNRIFQCMNSSILMTIIVLLKNGFPESEIISDFKSKNFSSDELKLIIETIYQLKNLIKIEQNEFNCFQKL